MTQKVATRGMSVFCLIWFGQLISLIGSGFTSFALGVWVYQRTGSVAQYALVTLFITLPGILIAPLAGALVDRWNRRWMMILCELGAGLSTLLVALLLIAGQLELWQIYLIVAVRASFGVFRWPAYAAITTLLVPKEQLGRANGMVQIAQAAATLLPPVLAGVLMATIQIQGVILIDFATFLFAIGTLVLLQLPRPESTTERQAGKGSLLQEAAYGWKFIRSRAGLFGLLLLIAVVNLLVGTVEVLVTPLVLSVTSPAELGLVLSIGGTGMLFGSLTMIVWRGPKYRINGVLAFMLLDGSCIVLGGVRPLVPLFAVATFGFFFGLAFVNGYSWAIWQSKVPSDVQGRVFATVQMVTSMTLPVGYLLAGLLADGMFEPLLVEGGALSETVGRMIGVGPGRGIGLLFIILGSLMLLITVLAYLQPRLRFVEDELPGVLST